MGKIFNMKYFKEVVLYIISKINGEQLGKVRLNKILWFADLSYYRRVGKTITNDIYIKKDFGPISSHLDAALNELQEEGKISHKTEIRYMNTMHIIKPCSDEYTFSLPSEERSVLNSIINSARKMRANDISEKSHDAVWENTPEDSPIDISAALGEINKVLIPYENIKWNTEDAV